VGVLVAVGVDEHGFREILGVMEGAKEDKASWTKFLRHLKGRALQAVELIVSDSRWRTMGSRPASELMSPPSKSATMALCRWKSKVSCAEQSVMQKPPCLAGCGYWITRILQGFGGLCYAQTLRTRE